MVDKIRNTGGKMRKEKAKILYKQKSKNFLKGFWCPTHGGNLCVLVNYTSSNASSSSDDMEPWSRCCNDVTVWLFLCELDGLLLFKNQKAVELCRCLLSVCVST